MQEKVKKGISEQIRFFFEMKGRVQSITALLNLIVKYSIS